MRKKLLKSSFQILLFTAFLLGFATQGVYGQTTLDPGDIAIVTVNADEHEDFSDKFFDIVPLIDLEEGTVLKFTDAAYNDKTDQLETNEGTITYDVPDKKEAGSVITYTGADGNGFTTDGVFNPSGTGDNIIVYQEDSSTNDTTYLFGVGWARGPSVWENDPDNNRSAIPPNLNEEDNTILSLGTAHNLQYDGSNGLEGTATSLLTLIGDETNWIEDDENAFSPFSSSFSLIELPTIAFATETLSGEEGEAVDLSVELVESNNEEVNIDVAFVNNSSTASNGDDFDNYTTTTINFDSEASNGTIDETISINLKDDNDFEGTEKAVFHLKNNTEGNIIEPNELTLSIEDDDAPNIVINEILVDPGGNDVDGNGNTDHSDDEFVEFVNKGSRDIDISDWEFSDDSVGIVKTFPEGTVIPRGRSLVLFNNDSDEGDPKGNFGGALIQVSDGSLSLNNNGDTPTLYDSNNNLVDYVEYTSSSAGVSINRNSAGTDYVEHSDISDQEFSPGTKVNGTPFGSKHAIGIHGSEGWRMISSPVENASFNDLFGNIWMQGLDGSDDPDGDYTLFSWNEEEGGEFIQPGASMDDNLTPGQGYIVYIFEDDEYSTPGVQGGFPKIISSDGTENETVKNITITATDNDDSGNLSGEEGWNLLGNPFGTDILVDEVLNVLQSAVKSEDSDYDVNAHLYVWDHENADYHTLSEGEGETIAPFQAFFVRVDTVKEGNSFSVEATFKKDNLAANKGTEFFKNSIEKVRTFDLELHGEQNSDTYSVEFSEKGTTNLDRYDAYELFSLNSNSISLYSTLSNNRLQKNALPRELESTLEIPLSFSASGRESLTFKWDELQDIPNDWDVILVDKEMNREIDLRTNKEYSFNRNVEDDQSKESFTASNKKGLLNRKLFQNKSKDDSDSRFVLSVQPKESGSNNDIPQSVKLNPNYPNPFNPQTTIPYELNEDAEVTLTVWNMIGQKVATLVDGQVEAGEHEEPWNASNMPSGMYIARFEVAGEVFTRKMTLIK